MKNNRIELSDSEITLLKGIIDDKKSSAREKQRAGILLVSDEKRYMSVTAAATMYNVTRKTVQNVRTDYIMYGAEATIHRKKRGSIKTITKKPNPVEQAVLEYVDKYKKCYRLEQCSMYKIRKYLVQKGFRRGISQASVNRILNRHSLSIREINKNNKRNKEDADTRFLSTGILGDRQCSFDDAIDFLSHAEWMRDKILSSYERDLKDKVLFCQYFSKIEDFVVDKESQTIKIRLKRRYNEIFCPKCGYSRLINDNDILRWLNIKDLHWGKISQIKNSFFFSCELYVQVVSPFSCDKCFNKTEFVLPQEN